MKKLFLMAIAVLALVSCSTTPSERVVTVSDPEFSGFAAKYLEVVNGDYKFITDGDEGKITIKLRKKAQPDEPFYSDGFAEFRLNAIGDGGEIYDTGVYGYEASMGEFDKIEDLLTNGEVGDTRSVCFTWNYLALKDSKDVRNKIYNSATGIELIDKGFQAGIKPEKASSAKEDVAEAGDDYEIIMAEAGMDDADDAEIDEVEEQKPAKAEVSSKEIDKFIDKFEKMANKAAKMYKKAEAGDRGAYAKWTKLSLEVSELMKSAKFDESDMTPSQVQRVMDITNKYYEEISGETIY